MYNVIVVGCPCIESYTNFHVHVIILDEGNHKGTHLGISSTARKGGTVNDPSLPICSPSLKLIKGYVGDSG